MKEKLPLSVSLVSLNEEDNIARTLSSVKDIASEIVLVDAHSTDKTREIAKDYGAKVFEEDWKGEHRDGSVFRYSQFYYINRKFRCTRYSFFLK